MTQSFPSHPVRFAQHETAREWLCKLGFLALGINACTPVHSRALAWFVPLGNSQSLDLSPRLDDQVVFHL
jgi:hypothetical protein